MTTRAKPRTPKPPPTPESPPVAGQRWEIHVPGWRPVALNQLLSAHWAKAGRMKAADRAIIATYTILTGVPKAIGKRRLSLRITLPPKVRRCDDDAHWKSVLDGAVHAGLLVNDSPVWLEMGAVTYERGERLSTTIIVEDIS